MYLVIIGVNPKGSNFSLNCEYLLFVIISVYPHNICTYVFMYECMYVSEMNDYSI